MRAHKTIRWTIGAAAAEFGLDRNTLSDRLRGIGLAAGKDGCFSTRDICAAVFGDYDGEKTRLTREQADVVAIKKLHLQRRLVPIEDVMNLWRGIILAFRERVMSADITTELREDLLETLEQPKLEEYFTVTKEPDSGDAESPETA